MTIDDENKQQLNEPVWRDYFATMIICISFAGGAGFFWTFCNFGDFPEFLLLGSIFGAFFGFITFLVGINFRKKNRCLNSDVLRSCLIGLPFIPLSCFVKNQFYAVVLLFTAFFIVYTLVSNNRIENSSGKKTLFALYAVFCCISLFAYQARRLPNNVNGLIIKMGSNDMDTHSRAALKLVEIGGAAGFRLAFKSENSTARSVAVQYCSALDDPSLESDLLRLCHDRDEYVRMWAIKTLGKHINPQVEKQLQIMQKDPSAIVRRNVEEILEEYSSGNPEGNI